MRKDGSGNGDLFDRNLTDFRMSMSYFSLDVYWLKKICIFIEISTVCDAQTMLIVLIVQIVLASKLSQKTKKSKEFLKSEYNGRERKRERRKERTEREEKKRERRRKKKERNSFVSIMVIGYLFVLRLRGKLIVGNKKIFGISIK
jgi:hypothetical protein